MNPRGQIFIVSAASGTGKTTLVSRLLAQHSDIKVSVSHTTRAPRDGETDGEHYHFVSTAEFERMIAEGAFLEHANVYGNYYGTSTAGMEALAEQGYHVILEIDVQGAAQVRRLLPQARSIFILPPSFSTLKERLVGRGTDKEDVIAERLAKAREEIEQAYLFDYIVINDSLEQAEQDLYAVIRASALTQAAQTQALTRILAE